MDDEEGVGDSVLEVVVGVSEEEEEELFTSISESSTSNLTSVLREGCCFRC